MESIKDWLKREDIKELHDRKSVGEVASLDFFRDPFRTVIHDKTLMYSPADGIVMYALDRVEPDNFLEVKGESYSLKDLLADEDYKEPSLVVGIFMTSMDVHVNRVPNDSYYLESRDTENLYTHNSSMLLVEHSIFDEGKFNYDKMGYLFSNERKISTFYSPFLRGRYYIVQIGDRDVDVILNWGVRDSLKQGQRFGQVRWGSQVDLIIPLDGRVKYELMVKKLDHVEAGLDPVVKVVGGLK